MDRMEKKVNKPIEIKITYPHIKYPEVEQTCYIKAIHSQEDDLLHFTCSKEFIEDAINLLKSHNDKIKVEWKE